MTKFDRQRFEVRNNGKTVRHVEVGAGELVALAPDEVLVQAYRPEVSLLICMMETLVQGAFIVATKAGLDAGVVAYRAALPGLTVMRKHLGVERNDVDQERLYEIFLWMEFFEEGASAPNVRKFLAGRLAELG